jgi:putative membrane protein
MNMRQLVFPAKSVLVGASMLVPGVSGGTMAILLGIYDDVIHALSRFTDAPKKNFIILAKFLAGSLVGIALLARLIEQLITLFPQPMMYLFLGAIAGGVPTLYKKTGLSKFSPIMLLHIAGGFLLVWLCSLIPGDLVDLGAAANWTTYLWLVVAGVIVAIALVLPGISASQMLLMLGLYEVTLRSIREFRLDLIAPLAIGIIGGTLATTRVLENMMTRHPRVTYLWILGFVLGSILEVFPGLPTGWNWLYCPLTLAAGFLLMISLAKVRTE